MSYSLPARDLSAGTSQLCNPLPRNRRSTWSAKFVYGVSWITHNFPMIPTWSLHDSLNMHVSRRKNNTKNYNERNSLWKHPYFFTSLLVFIFTSRFNIPSFIFKYVNCLEWDISCSDPTKWMIFRKCLVIA